MERFDLEKLKELEAKEQCRVGVSKTFAALEDSDAEVYCEAWSCAVSTVR
jgi:hypothetical protein